MIIKWKGQHFLSAEDVAFFFGKQTNYLSTLFNLGKINRVKYPSSKPGKKYYIYPLSELRKLFGEPIRSIQEAIEKQGIEDCDLVSVEFPEEKKKTDDLIESDFSGLSELLGNDPIIIKRLNALQKYNKADFDKFLKMEMALSKLQDSMKRSGNFVEISTLENFLEEVFSGLFGAARNLIDNWQAKYFFSEEITEKMERDFEKTFSEALHKIKRKLENERVEA